jgi:hypothetical protein
MLRRDLIRSLFTLPLLGGGVRVVARVLQPNRAIIGVTLFEAYVAGVQHHQLEGSDALSEITLGTVLMLKREPENEYDRFAVSVNTPDGICIGYLPRWINKIPGRLLDNDVSVQCEVTKINEDEPLWHRIKVAIVMER